MSREEYRRKRRVERLNETLEYAVGLALLVWVTSKVVGGLG